MSKFKQNQKTGKLGHLIRVYSSYTCTLQYSFAHRYIFFLFSLLLTTDINLIGCHRTTLVLGCVRWHKLKVLVSFEKVRRVISCDFFFFFWLRATEFFCHRHTVPMKSLLFKQVLTFNRLTWKKNKFSVFQVTQVKKLVVDLTRSCSFFLST